MKSYYIDLQSSYGILEAIDNEFTEISERANDWMSEGACVSST